MVVLVVTLVAFALQYFLHSPQIDENPRLTISYLNLMTVYCQALILISRIDDRKIVAGLFVKVYLQLKSSKDANIGRLAQFFGEYENPFKRIIEDFKQISGFVGKALVAFRMSYLKIKNTDGLRNEGTINLTLNPAQIALPSQDQVWTVTASVWLISTDANANFSFSFRSSNSNSSMPIILEIGLCMACSFAPRNLRVRRRWISSSLLWPIPFYGPYITMWYVILFFCVFFFSLLAHARAI